MPTFHRSGRLSGWLRGLAPGLADLVLGSSCSGCRVRPGVWCSVCRDGLPGARVVTTAAGVLVSAAGPYDGPLGRALLAHKEHGRLALARPLGRHLASSVAVLHPPTGTLLIPVPSRAGAVRARGQDHARRLAAAAARSAGSVLPALEVVRPVGDQGSLSGRARRANVVGAFAVRRGARAGVAGRPVVVVDDVVTTGSSLSAAVLALRAADAHVVGCAVVAVAGTQDPMGPPDPTVPRLA